MKTTLTTSQAAHILIDDKNANWSYSGAYALVEYLEELEDSTGEEMEFCHVAIRCDWAEYSSALEVAREYGFDWTPELYDSDDNERDADEVEEELEKESLEWLESRTNVIEFDGGIIVSSF